MKKFVGWKFPSLPGRSAAGELSSAIRKLAEHSQKRKAAEPHDDRDDRCATDPDDKGATNIEDQRRRRDVGVS